MKSFLMPNMLTVPRGSKWDFVINISCMKIKVVILQSPG